MDRLEIENPYYNDLNEVYQFFGSGDFSTGNPGADFLLGIPDTYLQGSGAIIRARGREYYSYAQDQWQLKRNLTLTLGVGWDVETPFKNLYANGEILGAFARESEISHTLLDFSKLCQGGFSGSNRGRNPGNGLLSGPGRGNQ